ncbi:hypothetical protein CMU04_06180 [Elizabethkingia anophelis]|nr:hypothetical protein [Elizabethkingia anophelis]
MELELREIESVDIPVVNNWLKQWKLNKLDEGMYPDTGLVLQDAFTKEGIYMGFVWCSNSKMAMIGFITRNPNYKNKLPKQTREKFIADLSSYSRGLGFTHVITWTDNKLLINDFKNLGYTETSDKVSELITKFI